VSEEIISPCGNFRLIEGTWVQLSQEPQKNNADSKNHVDNPPQSQNLTDNVVGGDVNVKLENIGSNNTAFGQINQNITGNVVQGDMNVNHIIVNNTINMDEDLKQLLKALLETGISDSSDPGLVLSTNQFRNVKEKLEEIENYSINDAKILLMLGNASKLVFQPKEAEKYFKDAMEMFSKEMNDEGEIMALISLGGIYKQNGKFDDAVESFGTGIQYAKDAGLQDLEARAECDFGHLYFMMNDFDTSRELFEKSLESIGNHTNPSICLEIYLRLGELFANENNPERNPTKAKKFFVRSMEIARKMDNIASINRINLYLGNFELAQENYQTSSKYFKEIRQSLSDGNEDSRTLDAKIGQGRVLFHQKNYDDAIIILEVALKFSSYQEYTSGIAYSCYYLGKCYSELGNDKDALTYFQISLEKFSLYKNLLMELQANIEIGMIYRGRNQMINEYLIRAKQLKDELRL
jgi:tetratricopeptide (TPR) repeat protein